MAEVETAQLQQRTDAAESAAERAAGPLAEAIAIMARLRAPGGCPWDREQTFDTIKRYTLEETYEVFDAIERRAWPELKDELGDLLLQVLFYAQMASEAGHFDIARRCGKPECEACAAASACLSCGRKAGRCDRRGCGATQLGADQAGREACGWGENDGDSGDGWIPRSMPAMMEARKLGSKAAKVGFDWPDAEGLFEKLQEEIGELKAELAQNDAQRASFMSKRSWAIFCLRR